jgi:HAD superfamily hydrolase (TIGR01458 family)
MPLTTIDGLLLDMDGVLAMSSRPLPGAAEAVMRLRAAGVPMLIVTNTTAYSRSQLGEALRAAGFPFADEAVLTAVAAAGSYLREERPAARVFLLGDARPDDLDGVDLVGIDEQPEVVLVSGADDSFTFATFNRLLRLVRDGVELVTMHRNLTWMTHKGENLDAGAYLLGLEAATGREALVIGKPAPEFFGAGLEALGSPASRVAMVGDDVENDVLAAQALGMTGVLVRTGKYREETLARASGTPDHVVDGIGDVPELLGV